MRVLLSAVLFLFHGLVYAQGTLTLVSGPTNSVSVGEPFSVWVNVLNPSSAPVQARFPAALQARLKIGATSLPCQLSPANDVSGEEVSIAPGAFSRRQYSALLPSLPAGPTLLEITNLMVGPVGLTVSESPARKTLAAEESKDPTSESSTKSGFDPMVFFKRHFFAYEPIYFIAGPDSPNGKFQFSFKYKLMDSGTNSTFVGSLFTNTYFAYTQISLWDLSKPSSPFADSSYKPEAFYYQPEVLRTPPDWLGLGFQTGFQHESNGKDGDDSRSLNLAYIKPIVRFGYPDQFHAVLATRAWFYVGGLDDNPDLPRYRGYFDVQAVLGWPESIQLRSLVRVGDAFDRASLTLDLSYPVWKLGIKVPWYLYAQYFIGYGESLLHYQDRSSTIRVGLAVYR